MDRSTSAQFWFPFQNNVVSFFTRFLNDRFPLSWTTDRENSYGPFSKALLWRGGKRQRTIWAAVVQLPGGHRRHGLQPGVAQRPVRGPGQNLCPPLTVSPGRAKLRPLGRRLRRSNGGKPRGGEGRPIQRTDGRGSHRHHLAYHDGWILTDSAGTFGQDPYSNSVQLLQTLLYVLYVKKKKKKTMLSLQSTRQLWALTRLISALVAASRMLSFHC